MKFKIGENQFRVLDNPIVGWEGWTEVDGNRKPLRKTADTGFKLNEVDPDSIKHFWAMPVWNYDTKSIQILEITQRSIQKAIDSYVKNKNWGSPTEYDILVNRIGEGLDTEYAVTVNPKDPVDGEVIASWNEIKPNFDLNRLFEGGDPFGKEAK